MKQIPGVRAARLAWVAIVLGISACGGGGSSGGSGGGGVPASLTVSPTQLTVNADAGASSFPTANISITVNNGAASGTYVGANYTSNVITAAAFTSNGASGNLMLTFKDPSVIGPGTYTDTAQIAICKDSACASLQSGSQVTVPVTYTVTVNSTVSLSASPTVTGTGMPVVLTWSSTHAQSCTASGDWSGVLASAGTQTVTPTTTGLHTYSISCSNPGIVSQASITVTALAPELTFSAFPANVAVGKPVTLRWQALYAASCVASGDWSGALAPSGYKTLNITTLGTTNYHLDCSNSTTSAQKDVSVTVRAAPAMPAATAYRVNEGHDGVLISPTVAQFPAQSAPTWTRNLGAPVSYPLVVNGVVFVTTANADNSYGNQLYALDARNGTTIWGPIAIAGVYFGSGLTYDNGRVFVLMFGGDVHAFNASNGAALWTAQLPGYWYEASPNAYGGIVFVSGNAGLSAIDEASGAILWTTGAAGTTDWASPAISSEGVYIQEGYSCRASALDPAIGTTLWQTTSPCNTPWGYASVIKGGVFYGRVGASLDLFDAVTGTFKVQLASARAPAITDTQIFALNSAVLSATRASDLVQTWTFAGDGLLVTAPVVVNHTVFIGSSSGTVYGVDAVSGSQVWSGSSPAAISPDSENGGPMPPSGPAAGENLLIFTAGNSLVAWHL